MNELTEEQIKNKLAISNLEAAISGIEQIELEIVHHFSPGLYAREIHIPAGVVLSGKIHKTEHLCTLSGDIEIATEDGVVRFTGYKTFVSKPGVKRMGFAHASTVFTTFHATNETDLHKLEDDLVCKTLLEYENFLLESLT